MTEITKERLKELLRAEKTLDALMAGGVDNWDGYDFSLENLYKEDERDEKLAEFAQFIIDEVNEALATSRFEEASSPGCLGVISFYDSDALAEKIIEAAKKLTADIQQ